MSDKVEVIESDRIWASELASAVFFTTRFNCAAAVESARELVKASTLAKDYPDFAAHIDDLLEGATVKVCEVLLGVEQVERAAELFARHRLAHLPNTDLPDERAREVLASQYSDPEMREALLNYRASMVSGSIAIAAMHQYAAGLRGEVDELKRQIEGLRLAGRHGVEALRRATEGGCDLCAGECRGHSLGHPEEWIPEPGSRSARTALGDTQ